MPFKAPGSVTFKKSDNALDITCQDGPKTQTLSLTPKRGRMTMVNIVIGGISGGLIDTVTDAHWDIVDSVRSTVSIATTPKPQPPSSLCKMG